MSDSTADEVEQLLEDERAALLAGDFEALRELLPRKEALVAALSAEKPRPDALRSLKSRAERNGDLLTAAAKGVRIVSRRMAEIRSANGPLRTYGQDGRQQTLGTVYGSLEKKA